MQKLCFKTKEEARISRRFWNKRGLWSVNQYNTGINMQKHSVRVSVVVSVSDFLHARSMFRSIWEVYLNIKTESIMASLEII